MLHLIKPNACKIEKFLRSQRTQEFSYPSVGGTNTGELPAGFDVYKNRALLGRGEETFRAACDALSRWRMFPAGWTSVYYDGCELRQGEVVAVLASSFRLWWLNACRIVYIIDDHQPTRRFGFAYGTLSEHVERGEERFMVEWDRESDQVWYEIYSFSRPQHPLVRAAYPLAKRFQLKFIRDSLTQMKQLLAPVPNSGPRKPAERVAAV